MTAAIFYILALFLLSLTFVSSVPQTRIFHGDPVNYGKVRTSYPFMARIVLNGGFKCGGALISDRFVATARHCLEFCYCFDEANPSKDWTRCSGFCTVQLREHSDFINDTETVHIIKTIHLPENSGYIYQRTDFALIELAESANTCTQAETAQGRCWPVTPVRLPDVSFQIKEGQGVRTLGWGANGRDEQSEFLKQLDITVNSSTLYHFIIETNVGPNGADPCKGDSGGPLLLMEDDLEWTLVGTLVGGGYNCEDPTDTDKTSEWNKIDLHVPWINSVMGKATVDEPDYPVTFTLTGEGDSRTLGAYLDAILRVFSGGNSHIRAYGVYKKTKTVKNGRPVWKQQNAGLLYLHYTGTGYWMFNGDYTRDGGVIASVTAGLGNVPATGWQYINRDYDWTEDPSIRVTY